MKSWDITLFFKNNPLGGASVRLCLFLMPFYFIVHNKIKLFSLHKRTLALFKKTITLRQIGG